MRLQNLCLVLGLGLLAVPTSAREGKNPPSLALHEKYRQIIVAKAVEPVGDEAFRFKTLKNLFRQAPAELTIRMAPDTARTLNPGKKYIVSFTQHQKVRFPGLSGKNPDGPTIVRIPQTEDAVFEYSRSLRRLITWQPAGKNFSKKKLLSMTSRLLSSEDRAVQRFAASEIAQRQLMETAGAQKGIDRVEAFVRDPDKDGNARNLLLLTAGRLPMESGGWRLDVARQFVTETDLTLDKASLIPGLVRLSLKILEKEGAAADAEAVARWLLGNHGPVAEAAVAALEALAPQTVGETVREALAQDDLNEDVRFVLKLKQKRLS
ncbi:MAG: hypothetical protein AAGM22_25505 [Acidobacteriota bacterium]